MNIASLISARLPVLRQSFGQELTRMEKLRREFVSDYSVKKFPQLKLEDYVIGLGKET